MDALMTALNLNYFRRRPVSKWSHAGRLGFTHEFREDPFAAAPGDDLTRVAPSKETPCVCPPCRVSLRIKQNI